jgi:exonuclease III
MSGAAVADACWVWGLQGWHVTWSCSEDKKGYAGTAVLCRRPPLSTQVGLQLPDHDGEGRVVTVVRGSPLWACWAWCMNSF